MKKITSLLIISLLLSALVTYPQETDKNSKYKKNTKLKLNEAQVTGEMVQIKDDEYNALIGIMDEGSAGSIILYNSGTLSASENKLYNNGGNLYWNGSQLSTAGSCATEINDLSDGKTGGYCVFLGYGAGHNDDGTLNRNTGVGRSALQLNESGEYNSATGFYALFNNISGIRNTANGVYSLNANKTGNFNVALGANALYSNIAGSGGVAVGFESQRYAYNIPTEFENANTSVGYQSLRGSTDASDNTGNYNTSIGYLSLNANTSGGGNNAIGYKALTSNTSGDYNTVNGYQALRSNTIGTCNEAFGSYVLKDNKDGCYNIGTGYSALSSNTTGTGNSANGTAALYYNTIGDYNTAIGYNAGPLSPTYNNLINTIALGNDVHVTSSNQVRIGNSHITSIGGYADWTNLSDMRFKQNIKENVSGLDFILALRPITYSLNVTAISEKLGENQTIDENGNILKQQPNSSILSSIEKKENFRKSGFSAQEVEELINRLGFDFGGVDKPENDDSFYGLRYAEFVVPLVKAVQEQQVIIQNLKQQNINIISKNSQLEERLRQLEILFERMK